MARLRGEEADQVGQRDESFLGPWQERWPASRVLFDRKRFMPVQRNAGRPRDGPKPKLRWPITPAGSTRVMLPSRISRVTGSPQSRQGASMRTVWLGNSQVTDVASKPHCANQI